MFRENVIRTPKSKRVSPVVIAPKSDGTMRFRIDYRRLNTVKNRDYYLLPRMDCCLDSLDSARIFSSLDEN